LGKIEPNEQAMAKALDENWEVLTEGLQTVLRKCGVPDAYERLKDLTRGERVGREGLVAFVDGLDIDESEKERLKGLTPAAYLGLAEEIAAGR
jgi:adenylosuccinate lyase